MFMFMSPITASFVFGAKLKICHLSLRFYITTSLYTLTLPPIAQPAIMGVSPAQPLISGGIFEA